jgi:hypothetical protein
MERWLRAFIILSPSRPATYRALPSSEGGRDAYTIQGVWALPFNLPVAPRSNVAARSERPNRDLAFARFRHERVGASFDDPRN